MKQEFYVIMGLGETGLSCAKYCLARGLAFAVNDSRSHPPGLDELKKIAPDVEIIRGYFSAELISRASVLLVSPGVSLLTPEIVVASEAGIPTIGDTELFVQEVDVPIIAITGSNAKSTVTTLVAEMINATGHTAIMGGNIGIPVLDLLMQERPDFYVIEFSSFQLERTPSLHAKVATILNVCEDHMDRYIDMQEYIEAKKRIFNHCEWAIINRHDLRLRPNHTCKTLSFGLDQPNENELGLIEEQGQQYLALGAKKLLATKKIKIAGQHNVMNALSALAILSALQLDLVSAIKVLLSFPGLAHRCEFVREHAGLRWYNDSKGTNVGATLAAIEGLAANHPGKIVLIAGGVGKGADFSPLCPVLKQHIRKVILLGEAAIQMATTFQGLVEIEHVDSLKAAVNAADLAAVRGDIVLLSPACASLDMFINYEDRGNQFVSLVKDL